MSNPNGPPLRVPTSMRDVLSGAYYIVGIVGIALGLIAWGLRQENRISNLERQLAVIDQRLNEFDAKGTRFLAERLVGLNEHLNNLDKREADSNTTTNHRIDLLIKRMIDHDDILQKSHVVESRQQDILRRLDQIEADVRRLHPNSSR